MSFSSRSLIRIYVQTVHALSKAMISRRYPNNVFPIGRGDSQSHMIHHENLILETLDVRKVAIGDGCQITPTTPGGWSSWTERQPTSLIMRRSKQPC